MGIFSFIKNIIGNHEVEMTDVNRQEAVENDLSLHVSLIKREEPRMVPLNKRIKSAIPTKRGLYPHEILLLHYAHRFSNKQSHDQFQAFWFYEYSVNNPAQILASLKERGFIKEEDLKSTLERCTVVMIKDELRLIGQKLTGKKAELISRLLENGDIDALESKYSDRYYTLTEIGQKELEENEYVPYLHQTKHMSIWEMNVRLSNNPKKLTYRDVLWGYFQEQLLECMSSGEMGEYSYIKRRMYYFVMEEGKYDLAFNFLCEVIACDLGGMGENTFDLYYLRDIPEAVAPYEGSWVKISRDYLEDLTQFQTRFDLTDEELAARLFEQFSRLKLHETIFDVQECVDITIAEINNDIETLERIYETAAKRRA